MRPTARVILAFPRPPPEVLSASLVNAASVARNRSARLRGRSSANSGLRQTNQAFAGKLRCGDLGRIALVEQRELEGAGIEQGADLRGSERGDLVEPGPSQLVANAGRGDHPAVPDQHHPCRPKRCLSLSTYAASVIGSAVLPANTLTATGQPPAAHSRPETICSLPFLASRE